MFFKKCDCGGKRGDAASCGWTLSVARDLDEHMCPRWSRIVEVSHLLDTSGILDKDLLDSFVAELCGMCEVVFALASLVCKGHVQTTTRCLVDRQAFNVFPGFIRERFELSPAANCALLVRRSESLANCVVREFNDAELRCKKLKIGSAAADVFGNLVPFLQNSLDTNASNKARRSN